MGEPTCALLLGSRTRKGERRWHTKKGRKTQIWQLRTGACPLRALVVQVEAGWYGYPSTIGPLRDTLAHRTDEEGQQ